MKALALIVFLFSCIYALEDSRKTENAEGYICLEDFPEASKDAGTFVSPMRPEHVLQAQASFLARLAIGK